VIKVVKRFVDAIEILEIGEDQELALGNPSVWLTARGLALFELLDCAKPPSASSNTMDALAIILKARCSLILESFSPGSGKLRCGIGPGYAGMEHLTGPWLRGKENKISCNELHKIDSPFPSILGSEL